jgi:hypothetical protein
MIITVHVVKVREGSISIAVKSMQCPDQNSPLSKMQIANAGKKTMNINHK